jgi:putative flippase GtrA
MAVSQQQLEFIKFVGLGALAALSNYVSRFAFDPFMPYEWSVVCAYLVGMVVAFVLFQKFVFGDAGDGQLKQAFRFTVVNIVGLMIAVAVSSLLARMVLPAIGWTFMPFATAHIGGIMAPTISSYFGHKLFTYRQTGVRTG